MVPWVGLQCVIVSLPGHTRLPFDKHIMNTILLINRYILNKWQILWNNSVGNKLFEIKPVIGQSQPVVRNVRQEEVVLARLRIGHTRITHSYLLKREEPPYCFGCDTLFTVRHFLLECGDFSHIRNKYFHVDTIKQLFNDVPIDNVFFILKRN